MQNENTHESITVPTRLVPPKLRWPSKKYVTMVDKEKKRFHEMAEKDKARYEMEMQNYVPPKGTVVGRGKKRKQPKDPNAPKRSL
uniref:HMG box domain-containing protein n=1 Tax=Glossina palpalis gambiensis TaxID=67801 RepID=A0A1B0ASY1_9MUSC